jgi:hypothetical protein
VTISRSARKCETCRAKDRQLRLQRCGRFVVEHRDAHRELLLLPPDLVETAINGGEFVEGVVLVGWGGAVWVRWQGIAPPTE